MELTEWSYLHVNSSRVILMLEVRESHSLYIWIKVFCFIVSQEFFLHIVIWYQVFLLNKNNLHTILWLFVWLVVLQHIDPRWLSNAKSCLFQYIKLFVNELFVSNTNQSSFVCAQLNCFKQCYLTLIVLFTHS